MSINATFDWKGSLKESAKNIIDLPLLPIYYYNQMKGSKDIFTDTKDGYILETHHPVKPSFFGSQQKIESKIYHNATPLPQADNWKEAFAGGRLYGGQPAPQIEYAPLPKGSEPSDEELYGKDDAKRRVAAGRDRFRAPKSLDNL